MIDVMFVEQKKTRVKSFRQMFHWEEYGFRVLSIADNEQQAISYFGEYRHGLIFMNLTLRQGDGFSLIRKLKTLDPDCTIIVITEIEDYASIRKAFRLGVFDYLRIKDMKVGVFKKFLQEYKNHHEEINSNSTWRQDLEHLLGQYRDHNEINTEVLYDILSNRDFSLLNERHRMVYFRMDHVRQINRKLKIYGHKSTINESENLSLYAKLLEQRDELQFQEEKVITEHTKSIPYILMFIKKHSGILIVPDMSDQEVYNLTHNLQKRMVEVCHFDFSFTIDEVKNGKKSFLTSLNDIWKRHEERFYLGDQCILTMKNKENFQHLTIEEICLQHKILNNIKNFQGELCVRQIHTLLSMMKQTKIYPDEVIAFILELLTNIEEVLKPKGFGTFTMQKEAVFECETYDFLVFEVDRMFKTLKEEIAVYKNKNQRRMKVILDFIDEHLGEKLDIAFMVSKIDGVSSKDYVSKLVKQSTGLSILQLILKKRMEKAADLLITTDWKVKQIAEKVGYQDQLYFTKTFKKYFECSPLAYRKKHM